MQLSKKKMRSLVEFDRDVEASLPLADGHVRVLPDSAPGGPASKQHPAAGAAAAGAAAAAEKGLAGTAHAAEGATQQQQQQQKGDGAAPQAVHAGLKSPPGASLQYRVTRSMAARASGATSPTSPLPGMARTSSRTGGIRQPGGARRRCLPLRIHLCTVVTAHLAVAALLGAGERADWWCCFELQHCCAERKGVLGSDMRSVRALRLVPHLSVSSCPVRENKNN